ncbi:hypothetical protein RB595_008167 [Gaeumannomyces hyphopodioides]
MSQVTEEHIRRVYEEYGELKVLDDIIRHRGADDPPVPILGYPRPGTVDDYETFTGKQVDCFVDAAAKLFMARGMEPNVRKVIGLLAPSDVDYAVSLFALSRLGYTVLALSLRIAPGAIANLLRRTDCHHIVHGGGANIEASLAGTRAEYPELVAMPMPTCAEYGVAAAAADGEPRFERSFDRDAERTRPAIIMHSSGSTGLPKPVSLSHRAVLTHPLQSPGVHNFGALPWFHLYGLSTALQAMYRGRTAYLYSAAAPLTADGLVRAVEAAHPEAVHVVPYALSLIAEKPRGVELLRRCVYVRVAGARTPDELGDRLVKAGVKLHNMVGTTEAGLAGETIGERELHDDSWGYIHFYPMIRPFIHMAPAGDGLFEAVYLKGHPALSASNSDDPLPGSWRSNDVFQPHPTVPDAWKYVTRLDDRVTLVNGEKVLPLPIEGRLREDTLVREAVVVGVDRSVPGLLVFRADSEDEGDEDAYLDRIWPSVADANSRAEGFSQITRDMVAVLPAGTPYPRTDKGSIIRAQVYAQFAPEIDALYRRLLGGDDFQSATKSANPSSRGRSRDRVSCKSLAGLEDVVVGVFRDVMGRSMPSADADFFAAGVDSLRAIQIRRGLQRALGLRGSALGANVVYDCQNAARLARHLHALAAAQESGGTTIVGDSSSSASDGYRSTSDGTSTSSANVEAHGTVDMNADGYNLMQQYIDKYSDAGETVLLSGATGSIGAHTLYRMASSPHVRRVYCLVRGTNPTARVQESLAQRGLTLDGPAMAKISAHTADLGTAEDFNDLLGVRDAALSAEMLRTVTLIVHIAWPVNFNIKLASFEPHIRCLSNLLRFSTEVVRERRDRQPARLFFCSSISVAANSSVTPVPDGPLGDLRSAADTGYGQSKLVGEHLVLNAARRGARSYVLRIGQVVGDAENGVWNEAEFIPAMIRSALTLGVLPSLDQTCSWLPVDTLATAILQLSQTLADAPLPCEVNARAPPVFYNVVNPHEFPWSELLAELKTAGLDFEVVPRCAWLERLRESAARGGEEERNPAVKLIDFYEKEFGGSVGAAGKEEKTARAAGGGAFEIKAGARDAAVLRQPPRIIEDGYVRRFVSRWLESWTSARHEPSS